MKLRRYTVSALLASVLISSIGLSIVEAEGDTYNNTYITNIHVCDHSGVESRLDTANEHLSDIEESLDAVNAKLEVVIKELHEVNEHLDSVTRMPRVTIVYSINNGIEDCYYKPKVEDLYMLEEKITKVGGFVKAYTGFFNLDGGEEYRPDASYFKESTSMRDVDKDTSAGMSGEQSRALEILGNDFLLEDESYTNGSYHTTKVGSIVTQSVAIMDIYKALGREINCVNLYFKPDYNLNVDSSPVALNLPSLVAKIDNSLGKTEVFVTRTNKKWYVQQAVKDLKVSEAEMDDVMTNGEFIVLLARMMNVYGEPVMSTAEMHALLQVYGAEIPTYLTPIEQDAYLYLKARGVLDLELDYRAPLVIGDMLDILMRVADEDSRTNYKQIQVTMELGSELVQAGYYPKTIQIAEGSEALEIESEYDYASAEYYDYYIQVGSGGVTFTNASGAQVETLFIPNTPSDHTSGALKDSSYLGKVTKNGIQYYHLQIPVMSYDSEYMDKSLATFAKPGYFQVNTAKSDDKPVYAWIEQGGGVYAFESTNTDGSVTLKRRNFEDNEFPGAVSKERKEGVKSTAWYERAKDFLLALAGAVTQEITAKADRDEDIDETATVKLTIYNAQNIKWFDKANNKVIEEQNKIQGFTIIENDEVNGKLIVSLPQYQEQYFLSNIERVSNNEASPRYQAIASISEGTYLLDWDDLVGRGLFFSEGGSVPLPETYDSSVLILNSRYGEIKLNNTTKEVVVGNTLYKVPKGTVLFHYDQDEKTGAQKLYVDFRAAYGWTDNTLKITITGSGTDTRVEVQTRDTNSKSDSLGKMLVKPPKSFTTETTLEYMQFVKKGVLDDDASYKAIMSSNYTLANWMIYQGLDETTGSTSDYLFIFYPEGAFEEGQAPTDLDKMKDIVGYEVHLQGWVCRAVKLAGQISTEPGKFSYSSDFGYVYNVPEWSNEMSSDGVTPEIMRKYLDGEYLLPIFSREEYDGLRIYNINVNTFSDYPYGTRPASNSDSSYVDICSNYVTAEDRDTKAGEKVGITGTTTVLGAAPAGVAAFYGSAKVTAYNITDELLRGEVNYKSASSVYYYGTTRFALAVGTAVVNYTSSHPWMRGWKVDSADKVYRINVSKQTASDIQAETAPYEYRWCLFDSVAETNKVELTEEQKKEAEIIEYIIADPTTTYDGYAERKLERLISKIDYGASFIIVFAFTVLPLVGLILLTVLLLLALLAENKFVQGFADRTVDLVKVLTFGKRNVHNFTFRGAFVSLFLGYLIFALLLQGNVFRIMSWCLETVGDLEEIFKYISVYLKTIKFME